jgi:hypothetical protein
VTDPYFEILRVLGPCPVDDLGGQGNCTCTEWITPEQIAWLAAEVGWWRASVSRIAELHTEAAIRASLKDLLDSRHHPSAEELR